MMNHLRGLGAHASIPFLALVAFTIGHDAMPVAMHALGVARAALASAFVRSVRATKRFATASDRERAIAQAYCATVRSYIEHGKVGFAPAAIAAARLESYVLFGTCDCPHLVARASGHCTACNAPVTRHAQREDADELAARRLAHPLVHTYTRR